MLAHLDKKSFCLLLYISSNNQNKCRISAKNSIFFAKVYFVQILLSFADTIKVLIQIDTSKMFSRHVLMSIDPVLESFWGLRWKGKSLLKIFLLSHFGYFGYKMWFFLNWFFDPTLISTGNRQTTKKIGWDLQVSKVLAKKILVTIRQKISEKIQKLEHPPYRPYSVFWNMTCWPDFTFNENKIA